jgi:hypothetical protein
VTGAIEEVGVCDRMNEQSHESLTRQATNVYYEIIIKYDKMLVRLMARREIGFSKVRCQSIELQLQYYYFTRKTKLIYNDSRHLK